MATLIRRRARDGSVNWQAQVRVQGYPLHCKTFRTKDEAESWASRLQAAAKGRTLAVSRGMTLMELIDEAVPPSSAIRRVPRSTTGARPSARCG